MYLYVKHWRENIRIRFFSLIQSHNIYKKIKLERKVPKGKQRVRRKSEKKNKIKNKTDQKKEIVLYLGTEVKALKKSVRTFPLPV